MVFESEKIIYYIIVIIFTYYIVRQYAMVEVANPDRVNFSKKMLGSGIAVLLTLLIGLMPLTGHYTADRGNMVEWYYAFKGSKFAFSWEATNYLFDNAYDYVVSHVLPVNYLFLPVSAIYFGCMLWACNKFFPKDGLIAFIVYLGAFSSYSYGVNGAKAGAAASLFLIAMAYRENWKMAALFCFLSLGFHHSMAAPIVVFVMTCFVKDRKYYLYVWLASCVIAALGITYFQEFFSSFTDDSGANYLKIKTGIKYVSGFRPDFILYSAVPIYLGYYFHKNYDIESDTYDFLLNLYTGTNAIFILCSYGTYINRIAYLSWLMYPIVLIYPFLKFDLGDNHYRYLKYAVYGHLGFTLFMWAIGK